MEYQFKTYGGITVIFIEAKLEIGSLTERLNCIAQVIAECDGMFWIPFAVFEMDGPFGSIQTFCHGI